MAFLLGALVSLTIVLVLCVSLALNSHMKLQNIQIQHPLQHNESLRDFVYTKPEQQSYGRVMDVYATMNVVDAPTGKYELIVLDRYGSAESMSNYFQGGDNTRNLLVLQQPFNATYVRNTTLNNENCKFYSLKLEGKPQPAFAQITLGKLSHLHLFIF